MDYGERRTGIAVGLRKVVETRPVIKGKDSEVIEEVKRLCRKEGVEMIVIGLSEGKMARKTKKFAKRLVNIVELPVRFVDETLTSWEAGKLGKYLKKTRGKPVDSLAAAYILERFFAKEREEEVNV